jgi:hypothetical protein
MTGIPFLQRPLMIVVATVTTAVMMAAVLGYCLRGRGGAQSLGLVGARSAAVGEHAHVAYGGGGDVCVDAGVNGDGHGPVGLHVVQATAVTDEPATNDAAKDAHSAHLGADLVVQRVVPTHVGRSTEASVSCCTKRGAIIRGRN